MSHEERRRRQPEPAGETQRSAVRYGDVFAVEGELAGRPVAPQDASMMQAAESAVLGRAPRGGAAAAMQSAARRNVRLGVVGTGDDATGAAAERGVAVTEARAPGARVVTEFVADQPVGQYIIADEAAGAAEEEPEAEAAAGGGGEGGRAGAAAADADGTRITIGEALEAAALSAGGEAVAPGDAAAIEAAEARAAGPGPGPGAAPRGGGVLAARARDAAERNALAPAGRGDAGESKATLRDVLADATAMLGTGDRAVEREDAARVVGAEVRGGPGAAPRPGGVAASVAAAARLNRLPGAPALSSVRRAS